MIDFDLSDERKQIQQLARQFTREHVTRDRVRVAGSGSVGWGYGTPAWPDGEFFRYSVEEVEWGGDEGGADGT